MSDILTAYPVSFYARRWPRLDPAWSNFSIALTFAFAFILGAIADGVLLLRSPNTGLLQHPGIWWFLIGQVWLPFVMRNATRRFRDSHDVHGGTLSPSYVETRLPDRIAYLAAWAERKDNVSRIIYGLLLSIGAAAWAWNTYSNAHPSAVGFDFWDSSKHFWSYWLTRLYKAYIWLGLLPAVVHAQVGLVEASRALIKDADANGGLTIEPFNADGAGGLTVFIDTVLSPMVPSVFIASMISLSAVVVHKRYDTTTIGGLSLACTAFLTMYLVPASTLRNAIRAEKKKQTSKIASLQQKLYDELTATSTLKPTLSESLDAISGLTAVAERVRKLPEWPQLRQTSRLLVLAWGSPAVAWLSQKGLERLITVVAKP